IAGSALLAGRNTQLTSGLTYTWYDQPAGQGAGVKGKTAAVTYWLEDVDLNGTRTLHGPIAPLPVVAPLPAKAGELQRAGLIGEMSLKAITDARLGSVASRGSNGSSTRTPVSGVEFRRWPAAFAEQVAAQRMAAQSGALSSLAQPDALRGAALAGGKGGKGGKRKVTFDPGVVQRQIESQPGIKLAVDKEGWYRITQPELVAAGYDPNTNAPQL